MILCLTRVEKEASIYTGFCGPPTVNTNVSDTYYCECPYDNAVDSKCAGGLDVFQCTKNDDSMDEDGKDNQDDTARRRKGKF